jgi:acyl-CoA thioesterase FadM
VFDYEVTEIGSGRLIADGKSVQVCFDSKEKRTTEIPAGLRKKVTEFEGLS